MGSRRTVLLLRSAALALLLVLLMLLALLLLLTLLLLELLLMALPFVGRHGDRLHATVALQHAHAINVFVAVAAKRLHVDDVTAVILFNLADGFAHGTLARSVATRLTVREAGPGRQHRCSEHGNQQRAPSGAGAGGGR
jgi:hypothetical protein